MLTTHRPILQDGKKGPIENRKRIQKELTSSRNSFGESFCYVFFYLVPRSERDIFEIENLKQKIKCSEFNYMDISIICRTFCFSENEYLKKLKQNDKNHFGGFSMNLNVFLWFILVNVNELNAFEWKMCFFV